VNGVTFNRHYAQGARQPGLRHFVFAACAALAAIGCSDDTGTDAGPVGTTAGTVGATAGTVGATAGTVGTTAGSPVPVAGAGTTTAGTGATTAGTGAAAGTGATTAGTGAAGAGAAGTGGGATPTLDEVFTLFRSNCAICHAMAPSDSANGKFGMITTKEAFHSFLVNKPAAGAGCSGKGMYVVPGDAANSLFIKKLKPTPPCGSQMPVGNPLPAADIAVFEAWVAGGAKM